MLDGLTLAIFFFSFIFVGKMCVFVSRPMKIVTFLRKNDYPPKRVVDFPGERDTFRNKIMEIVDDFDEKSYNNNGKSWKSSRILRVNPFFFIFLSFFIIFIYFFVFSFFHFFHFFSFFIFFITPTRSASILVCLPRNLKVCQTAWGSTLVDRLPPCVGLLMSPMSLPTIQRCLGS